MFFFLIWKKKIGNILLLALNTTTICNFHYHFGILAREHHLFRCLIIAYKLRAKLCCGNKK